jgi:hypothetical protein
LYLCLLLSLPLSLFLFPLSGADIEPRALYKDWALTLSLSYTPICFCFFIPQWKFWKKYERKSTIVSIESIIHPCLSPWIWNSKFITYLQLIPCSVISVAEKQAADSRFIRIKMKKMFGAKFCKAQIFQVSITTRRYWV